MKYENWIFGKDGALFSAAARGNLPLARELLSTGANANMASPSGYTPLHRAAQNGFQDIVQLLLDNGADPTMENKDSQTPLTLARNNNHAAAAEILAQALQRASISEEHPERHTPGQVAAIKP